MILIFSDILNSIAEFFWKILITLVAGIYLLINYTYQIFLVLAKTNIFKQEQYQALTSKIYVILGVVMMFIIAYNFLTLVADPDKNKGGATVEKMLKNIVISFILIVVMPSIFSFAFDIQDAILEQGIFNKFFTDVTETGFDGDNSIKAGGKLMATSTFNAFYKISEGAGVSMGKAGLSQIKNQSTAGIYKDESGKVIADCSSVGKCTLAQAQQAAYQTGSFSPYYAFAMNVVKDQMSFDWFISLVAGCYLLYVIISFCFDLAVRVCKLAFYQIIAPLAISCRILPQKEEVFTNWRKASVNTYISVFIRIFIMNLGVYLVSVFADSSFFDTACDDCSFGVTAFAAAFIILGIVTFMKSAAKLVDDIFGLGGDISLGIMKKLADGGAFLGGGALVSGITSMTRNGTHGWNNFKNAKGGKAKFGAAMKGLGSTIAGGVSGTVRGAKASAGAKNFGDMKKSGLNAAADTVAARDARQDRTLRYKAANQNFITGHISDWGHDVEDWATGGAEMYESTIKTASNMEKLGKAVEEQMESVMGKYKGNATLVTENDFTIDDFKGDKAALFALYTEYKSKGLSLQAIEADINRLKNITDFTELVDKSAYYSGVDYTALENARSSAVAAIDRTAAEFNEGGVFDKAKYDAACQSARAAISEDAYRTFDQAAYNLAVENAATAHAQKLSNLQDMYNQLFKMTKFEMISDIEDKTYDSKYGIKPKDVGGVVAAIEDYTKAFELNGNTAEFVETKADGKTPDKTLSFTGRTVVETNHDKGTTDTRTMRMGEFIDSTSGGYKGKRQAAEGKSARIRQQQAARKKDSK